MDIYFPTDQPETCPQCGQRAIIVQEDEKQQTYHCPDCSYDWKVDLTEDVAGTN